MLRPLGIAVIVYLAVLAVAGLEAGATAARGPENTLSCELVVDGARLGESQTPARGTPRSSRARRKPLPIGGSVHIARCEAEVEALRPAWEELQTPHLTSDLDYFLTLIRHAPGIVRPHVVLTERAGQPASLVVGRVEDEKLRARLGCGVGYGPRLRMLTVAYGGFLGECASSPGLLERLRHSLAGERVDLLRLRMLTVGSPEHAAATGEAGILRRRGFAPKTSHWRCSLPGSFEEFLAERSKESRRYVRRYGARLEAKYQEDAEIRFFTSRFELDRLFEDSARVHRTTYQHALGVGFSDGDLYRRLTELTMDRGWFRGAVLYLREQPVAFWHGNAYRGTFGTTATGFDPAYSEDRPGTFLLMRLVESLCADPAITTLDFGFGDADYKRRFGDSTALEQDVVVFEPRARTIAINVSQTAVLGTASLARAALARTGRLRAARRAWRRRVSGSRRG